MRHSRWGSGEKWELYEQENGEHVESTKLQMMQLVLWWNCASIKDVPSYHEITKWILVIISCNHPSEGIEMNNRGIELMPFKNHTPTNAKTISTYIARENGRGQVGAMKYDDRRELRRKCEWRKRGNLEWRLQNCAIQNNANLNDLCDKKRKDFI